MQPSKKVLSRVMKARESAGFGNMPENVIIDTVSTAHHEAGHFAAHVFFLNVPLSASIIPNKDHMGIVYGMPDDELPLLKIHTPRVMLDKGYILIIKLLAGRGVEYLRDRTGRTESILDEGAMDWESEEGSDLFRSAQIADIVARRGYPARRVLDHAEKLTYDMLSIPDVWACVERVAGLLLEHGTIEDPATLVEAEFSDLLGLAFKLPKWRRRLSMSRGPARIGKSRSENGKGVR